MNLNPHSLLTKKEDFGVFIREKRYHLIFALLCTAFVLMAMQSLNTVLLYTPDSANYLGWAQSLSEFRGFRLPFDIEPGSYVANAPLYALILAPLAWFFPLNVIAAKALTMVFGLGLLILYYRYSAVHASRGMAVLTGLFLIVHPQFLLFATQVLSEVPFMVAVFLCLMTADRIIGCKAPDVKTLLGMGLLLGLSVLLRELGVTLVAAVVFVLLGRKRYREAWIIFAVAASLYLLWYLRNEGLVGGAERPALSNTRLFLTNLFTDKSASLLSEFRARLSANLSFYAAQTGGLPFLSQFVGTGFTVVRDSEEPLSAIRGVVSRISVPYMVITAAIVLHGAVRMVKQSPAGWIVLAWAALYFIAVLLYPVADARFLFPLLFPFMLACAHSGEAAVAWLRRKKWFAPGKFLLGAAIVCLILPHVVWTENYLRASRAFMDDPVALNASFAGSSRYPYAFGKLFPQAAAWIAGQGSDSALVLCQHEEIALWLNGRRVMHLDPVLSIRDFENIVRDYRPAYLVNYLVAHTWGDFDYSIGCSRRFSFESVYRAGDTEVLKIARVRSRRPAQADSPAPRKGVREQFLDAVRLLQEEGKADSAMRLLSVWKQRNALPMYYYALSAEFDGRYAEADSAFRQFRSTTQAWSYVVHAQKHLELLRLLVAVPQAPSDLDRAKAYCSAAIASWQEGFRRKAIALIEQALRWDPENATGLVYAMLFYYEEGDLGAVESYLRRAEELFPGDNTVICWKRILTAEKQNGRTTEKSALAAGQMTIARTFLSMGLPENAIDRLLELLEAQPDDAEGWRLLAGIYANLGRSAPAQAALERLRKTEAAHGPAESATPRPEGR